MERAAAVQRTAVTSGCRPSAATISSPRGASAGSSRTRTRPGSRWTTVNWKRSRAWRRGRGQAADIRAPDVEVGVLAATPSGGRPAGRGPGPGRVLRVELQEGVDAVIEEDVPGDVAKDRALPQQLPDPRCNEGCRYKPAKAEALAGSPPKPAVGLPDHHHDRFHSRRRGLARGGCFHDLEDLIERILQGPDVLALQKHRTSPMVDHKVLDRRVGAELAAHGLQLLRRAIVA